MIYGPRQVPSLRQNFSRWFEQRHDAGRDRNKGPRGRERLMGRSTTSASVGVAEEEQVNAGGTATGVLIGVCCLLYPLKPPFCLRSAFLKRVPAHQGGGCVPIGGWGLLSWLIEAVS